MIANRMSDEGEGVRCLPAQKSLVIALGRIFLAPSLRTSTASAIILSPSLLGEEKQAGITKPVGNEKQEKYLFESTI